jgi:septum formation protein
VLSPDVAEVVAGELPAQDLCAENARRKARAAAAMEPGALVIGADTIVVLQETVFGKPATLAEARTMLQHLAGQTHEVLTSVCMIWPGGTHEEQFTESTRVTFRSLAHIDLDSYLQRINPLDKAGAYAAQDDDGALIENIAGCFQNVVGLPVPELIRRLKTLDAELLGSQKLAAGIRPPVPLQESR